MLLEAESMKATRIDLSRIWARLALPVLMAYAVVAIMPASVEPAAISNNAKALYCAYGGIGMTPISPQTGFESQFAVAVIEIHSSRQTKNVAITDFVLLDRAGQATKLKRVVKVEEFNGPQGTTEGIWEHYLDAKEGDGTHLWNGTLPTGRIRLRVRVALIEAPIAPVSFRLKVGRYVIEGPVDASWGTG
jgi:hypothetical protein